MGTNERRHRRSVRQAITLLVLVVAGYFLFQTYSESLASAKLVTARFSSPEGKPLGSFKLELAATPDQRTKGMMFRRRDEVKEDEGMLFVFPSERPQRFWMKNTFLPLDMIFVNRKREVVGVIDSAVPLSLEERGVDAPSTYVVELLGGTAKKLGIGPRSQVVFEPEPPSVSR